MTFSNGGEIERQMIESAELHRVVADFVDYMGEAPAEVWCSECEQPAVGATDGRAYCERDMGVAVRAVGARRAEADKLVDYLTGSAWRELREGYSQVLAREDVRAIVARIIACTIPSGVAYDERA